MESFIQRYNSDLANDFGNLLSRVSTLMKKNYDGRIPDPGELSEAELRIKTEGESLCGTVNGMIMNMRLNEAIENTMQYIRSVNKYMEENAPWKLVKEDKSAAGRILYTAGEALRLGAVLLSPVMPNRTAILLDVLNAPGVDLSWGGLKPGETLKDHEPLFPRVK
jgi:methionyl-tRNA synthetase